MVLKKLHISCRRDAARLFIQFVKLSLVGVLNTVVSLAVYYIFIWARNDIIMIMTGQVVGWFIGVANSFVWNKKFVFKESEEIWWRALAKMYIGYTFSLIMSLFLTYMQVEWLGISSVLAPLLNLIITVPMNFLTSKYWSFFKRMKTE